MNKQPDETISQDDKGDDTQRRFRYQSTYAAILSVHMCSEDSPIEEVYCELHEDILLKLKTGKFGGIQVKTRERHLGPLTLDNDEIKKSLKRFVKLNLTFPNVFEHFSIATNVGFSKEKNKCINTIVEHAKNGQQDFLLKKKTKSKTFISAVAKDADCDEQDVIAVLSKLRLFGQISSMEDIKTNLTQRVGDVLKLKSHTLGEISAIADKLILKHQNAASLSNDKSHEEYFILSSNPSEAVTKAIIKGKRITQADIKDLVKEQLKQPISLFIRDSTGIPKAPGSVEKLETKMDAGGISAENIELAKDQKYSFEALTLSWLYQYPEVEANKMYDQVILIVQNQCQEAYDESFDEHEIFGAKMLKLLRKKLNDRYAKVHDFFDCKYEHVLGVAGVLTEDCKVWWSKRFKL